MFDGLGELIEVMAQLAMVALGAVAGVVVSILMIAGSFFWPPLMQWAWVPPILGVFVGFIAFRVLVWRKGGF